MTLNVSVTFLLQFGVFRDRNEWGHNDGGERKREEIACHGRSTVLKILSCRSSMKRFPRFPFVILSNALMPSKLIAHKLFFSFLIAISFHGMKRLTIGSPVSRPSFPHTLSIKSSYIGVSGVSFNVRQCSLHLLITL